MKLLYRVMLYLFCLHNYGNKKAYLKRGDFDWLSLIALRRWQMQVNQAHRDVEPRKWCSWISNCFAKVECGNPRPRRSWLAVTTTSSTPVAMDETLKRVNVVTYRWSQPRLRWQSDNFCSIGSDSGSQYDGLALIRSRWNKNTWKDGVENFFAKWNE